jgi:hypothetical protein
MTTAAHGTIVGVFEDHAPAKAAVDELRAAGFGYDHIGMALREVPEVEDVAALAESSGAIEAGAKRSMLAGGLLGGLLGAAASFLIPGIGPVVAGGLLVGVGTGIVVGAAAGGLVGGLTGLGLPEEEAHYYDQEFRLGRVVVTVRAGDRFAEAQEILRKHGAYDIANPKTSPAATLHMERLDELG